MARTESRPVQKQRPSLLAIISGIGWPVLLGLGATTLFFVLIYRGPLNHPVMHRYFASHPVTFCETGLFFIGLAALCLKLLEVGRQYVYLGGVHVSPAPPDGQSVAECDRLMREIDQLPAGPRGTHLARRLRDAFEHVDRSGTAAELNDELKYLADVEAAKQQESYSLVRIVIWATPMLGFLGTVMGITEALGDLSANAKLLATSIDTAIQGLLGGLYVAFDTTALALVLSMVLMFIQYAIDRCEQQLLGTVDQLANQELVGRFELAATSSDPQVAVIERMAHSVVRSTEHLVQRQAQLWQGTIESAQTNWQSLFSDTNQQVQEALGEAMKRSLAEHSTRLEQLGRQLSDPLRTEWQALQREMAEQTRALLQQQTELRRQADILSQAIAATGEVMRLERALNDNLSALAGSKNFEDTVMSLSAAIHLLVTRLGKPSDGLTAGPVDLTRGRSASGLANMASGLGAGATTAVGASDEEFDRASDHSSDRHDESLDSRGARARLTEAEEYALKGKAA